MLYAHGRERLCHTASPQMMVTPYLPTLFSSNDPKHTPNTPTHTHTRTHTHTHTHTHTQDTVLNYLRIANLIDISERYCWSLKIRLCVCVWGVCVSLVWVCVSVWWCVAV